MSTHREAMQAPDAMDACPIMGNYGPPRVRFVRGQGVHLYDDGGREYLDFLSGIAVTSLGHSHPAIAAAICEQASTLLHVSNLFGTEPQIEVATTLDALVRHGRPDAEPGQVLFQNSGAEANEGAIKLARKYAGRGRHVVVSALRSFHGRTLATLAATGQPEKHEPFFPLPEGFRHAAWNDVQAFEAALDPSVGAILLEPLQGEGGVVDATAEFMHGIQSLCRERSLVLIIDEIQTGLARTGEWFGFQHHGLDPDIVTIAKALGNGMPIGAVWAKRSIASAFKPGDHGSTFGGQPLAASAAAATLKEMLRIDAPTVARDRGAALSAALVATPGVVATRGRGLLLAAQFSAEVLAGRSGTDIANACLDAGLVVVGAGADAIRLAPPFIITDADIASAVATISAVLQHDDES